MDKDFRRGIYDPRFQTSVDVLDDQLHADKNRKIQVRSSDGQALGSGNRKPRNKISANGLPITKRLSGPARRNQVVRLARRDGWVCHWCGVDLSLGVNSTDNDTQELRYPTIDHIITKHAGGSNSDENCVIACTDCNVARSSTKIERKWRKEVNFE